VPESICTLCDQLGKILGGEVACHAGNCAVNLSRTFAATIEGRPVAGGHALEVGLTFGEPDASGRSLLLGEVTLLQPEVNLFLREVTRLGLRVSAIHNHWLFDQPPLLYVHFQGIVEPLRAARGLAPVLRRLAT
jgi:hypothetical protein